MTVPFWKPLAAVRLVPIHQFGMSAPFHLRRQQTWWKSPRQLSQCWVRECFNTENSLNEVFTSDCATEGDGSTTATKDGACSDYNTGAIDNHVDESAPPPPLTEMSALSIAYRQHQSVCAAPPPTRMLASAAVAGPTVKMWSLYHRRRGPGKVRFQSLLRSESWRHRHCRDVTPSAPCSSKVMVSLPHHRRWSSGRTLGASGDNYDISATTTEDGHRWIDHHHRTGGYPHQRRS